MQTPLLLDSQDYKIYLNQRLDTDPQGRGRRAALAKAIGCQNAYVSSVLRGIAHFTPEQGEAINGHLGHSEVEGEYFLLLLQLARAGTELLRARLQRQLQRLRDGRFDLKRRLAVGQTLAREDQATYYSDWVYAAVHTLTSVPGFTTTPAIATRLGIAPTRTAEIIEFLVSTGLVARGKGGFKIGQARIHLGADSPLVTQHHRNWRLQAMQKLSRRSPEDLHYSSVVTLSAKDVTAVKELIVAAIGEVKETVRASKEERLHSFAVDFFEV